MKTVTGIDLVNIPDFISSIQSGGEIFLRKIFTVDELKNPAPAHLAGIFAAKEAIIKALSIKPGLWHCITIVHQSDGRPIAKIKAPHQLSSSDLSISHSRDYAAALFVGIVH